VLVLDRAEAGADTLSTHALTRGAVVQLRKYGVLDTLVARGTPAIRRSTFHFPDDELALDLEPRDGVDALYAPRRTVLDPVLVEEAMLSGADVRLGCRVKDVTRNSTGVVTGVRFTDPDGDDHQVRASITVGADGTRSSVARAVEAPTTWQGSHAGAILYGHFPDPGVDGYHWFYALGAAAGIIPTNDGSVCAWVGTATDRFMGELRGEPDRAFTLLMSEAAPEWASVFPPSAVGERLFGFGGQPSYLRQPVGHRRRIGRRLGRLPELCGAT
jgi:2-polyprenyl-6-methoxyphenol hydroxylase-like FAD-dependent oxidoreductase